MKRSPCFSKGASASRFFKGAYASAANFFKGACASAAPLLALLACLQLGCEVGQPLVDRVHYVDDEPPLLGPCPPAPDCADYLEQEPFSDLTVRSIAPVELAACGGADEEFCGAPPGTGNEDDAGAGEQASDCASSWVLGGAKATEPEPLVVDCSSLHIVGAPVDGGVDAKVAGVRWSRSNVSISSETPLRLVLEAASLREVWIHLEGFVTLVITHAERMDAVRITTGDVRFARVELEGVGARDLLVGDDAHPFEGALSFVRSTLMDVQLLASEVELESVYLWRGLIRTDRLEAADANFRTLLLEVDSAVIAASDIESLRVSACGALTFLGSSLRSPQIVRCRDYPTRVYGSEVTRGYVDGHIDGDESAWQGVRFGLFEPTELVLRGRGVTAINFCAFTQSVGLASLFRCSKCGDELDAVPRFSFCIEHPPATVTRSNWCVPLNDPPLCPEPLARARPVTAPWAEWESQPAGGAH